MTEALGVSDWTAWLPGSLEPSVALLFVAASFFTSALTASMGIGGGILMLAIMAYGVPVAALIPVHGAVQLGSNAGRFLIQHRHVAWPPLLAFALGAAGGALLGARFVLALPEALLLGILGTFILTWLPMPHLSRLGTAGFAASGLVSTFLSMFVGATGPLNAAIFGQALSQRLVLVATLAGIMTAQHVFKVIGFAVNGFDFSRWLPLVAAMIASGLAGTACGSLLLSRLPEMHFRSGLRLVLTLLSLDLVRRSLS
jgi:uncharacterized protein